MEGHEIPEIADYEMLVLKRNVEVSCPAEMERGTDQMVITGVASAQSLRNQTHEGWLSQKFP